MHRIGREFADATVLTIGFRPSLERFYVRKLVLERVAGSGVRVREDEAAAYPGPERRRIGQGRSFFGFLGRRRKVDH